MIFPDSRLLAAVAIWTVAALSVPLLPFLWALLAAAALAIATLVLWDLAALRRQPPPRLERRLPARGVLGRPATVEIAVANGGSQEIEVLVVDDPPADVNAADGALRLRVAAASTSSVTYPIQPARRGDRPFGAPLALQRSPLGLWLRRVVGESAETLRVYPDASRLLRPQALDPRQIAASTGTRPARQRGEGMELDSLRDYVSGDDPRRIDWSASARRGRLVTRLYRLERNHTVVIALDTSRLMAGELAGRTKLDHAVDAALSLTHAALVCSDRVGMVAFDLGVHAALAPRRRHRDLADFLEVLRPLQPRLCEPSFAALTRHLAENPRQRALVVVFTDFADVDTAAVIAPLLSLARHHRVLLVAIRDHLYDELEPHAAASGDEAPLALYRRLALHDLLREREVALTGLRRGGVQTLDLVPEALTAAVLNRYLALRAGPQW